jgi:hypothetical protein
VPARHESRDRAAEGGARQAADLPWREAVAGACRSTLPTRPGLLRRGAYGIRTCLLFGVFRRLGTHQGTHQGTHHAGIDDTSGVRSSWEPTENDLKEYAEGPIGYEMEMVVLQLRTLAAAGAAPHADVVVKNALLEACLVHIRLLDDFLGSPVQAEPAGQNDRDDVFAGHWLPGWTPQRFLTHLQISDINAQLAHLAARRQHWNFGWPLSALASACATKFEEFCAALEAANPDRAQAFEKARYFARSILT